MAGSRILLVSDEPGPAEITSRLLARAGHDVEHCTSLEDALVKLSLAEPPFDLVIADFADGVAPAVKLLDRIRDTDIVEIANVRILIATDDTTNRLFAWQSGADEFLVRPYHADEFLDAVQATLDRDDDERRRYREMAIEELRASE